MNAAIAGMIAGGVVGGILIVVLWEPREKLEYRVMTTPSWPLGTQLIVGLACVVGVFTLCVWFLGTLGVPRDEAVRILSFGLVGR